MLSDGPISHNSIHLLIITTDFVTFYWFTGYKFSLLLHFLSVLSLGNSVCSILKFCPVFLGS